MTKLRGSESGSTAEEQPDVVFFPTADSSPQNGGCQVKINNNCH